MQSQKISDISGKRLVSRIYKEFLKLNNETSNLTKNEQKIKKEQKDLNK